MKKMPCLCAASLLLGACAAQQTQDVSADHAYDPAHSARIRLFGQNQKPSIMTIGKDCATGARGYEINVGGGLGDAFKSLVGSASNKSLGMPETETMRQLSRSDGLLSQAFYQEFVIPAGKPVQVYAAFIGLATISEYRWVTVTGKSRTETVILRQKDKRSRSAAFVSEAGKDYEAIGVAQGVEIYDVTDGTPKPVASVLAEECGK